MGTWVYRGETYFIATFMKPTKTKQNKTKQKKKKKKKKHMRAAKARLRDASAQADQGHLFRSYRIAEYDKFYWQHQRH